MNIAIPEEYYGSIAGHSGLANTYGITVRNGTIDSNYWGIVCLILFNYSNEEYTAEIENRVGQLTNYWTMLHAKVCGI